MSLLAAILSQTNKILGTLINFTGTFPTSTINTINTNTQPAAQASDTQTGLSNQGYSSTRAGKIDNLDTTVSSRAVATTSYRTYGFQNYPGTGVQSTIVSIAGTGEVNGCVIRYQGVLQSYYVRIICDGNVVCDASLYGPPGSGNQFWVATPSGQWCSVGTGQTSWAGGSDSFCDWDPNGGAGVYIPYCGFKFKSSLQIQIHWYNVGQITWGLTYSLA